MNSDQHEFASIRVGGVFRLEGKTYEKVSDRTAVEVIVNADGSREIETAFHFDDDVQVQLIEDVDESLE